MKHQDLAEGRQIKHAEKIFESYFGKKIEFSSLSSKQARKMLQRVQSMISEHRRSHGFHSSERDPSYLKLMLLEQGLVASIREEMVPTEVDKQGQALQAKMMQDRKRQLQDAIRLKERELQTMRSQLSSMTALGEQDRRSSRARRRISESEIQQAQVMLAAQDMVDNIQGVIEDVTSMLFKDLPALVDQIKNEVGQNQANQFNSGATQALNGLVQNLQSSKQQLEQSLGVITGDATAQLPGIDQSGEQPAMPPAGELEAPEEPELPELPEPEEPRMASRAALGRGRR